MLPSQRVLSIQELRKEPGISDDGLNFYGGISYNGHSFYKILQSQCSEDGATDPLNYFASKQQLPSMPISIYRNCLYLVTVPGVYNQSSITNTIIKNGTGGVAHGNLPSANLIQGAIRLFAADLIPLILTYDVWMYAENECNCPLGFKLGHDGKVSMSDFLRSIF